MQIRAYLILHKNGRSKHNLLWSAALAFLLWTPHTLFADISTLERIVEAEHKVAYVGARLRTSSSSRGTRTFEEYVIHLSEDASYRKIVSVVGERRSFNGQPNRDERQNDSRRRENNENRRDRRERHRDRNEWRQIRNLFSEKEVELIVQNYNLEASASAEKIMNYETDILTITPKFAGRPTKRIFFARENGVILRVEDLDAEGILREMFVYTRISFNPKAVESKWKGIEKEAKPEQRRSYAVPLAEAKKMLKTEPVQPNYLPPGFQLQDVQRIKSKENNSILLEYTDGLVNFTLFEKTGKPPRLGNWARREQNSIQLSGTPVYKYQFEHRLGVTNAFRWSDAEIHFFLVGAIPADEMEKVAKSIIHKAAKEK